MLQRILSHVSTEMSLKVSLNVCVFLDLCDPFSVCSSEIAVQIVPLSFSLFSELSLLKQTIKGGRQT